MSAVASAHQGTPTRIDLAVSHPTLPSLTGLRWVAALAVFSYHIVSAGYFSADSKAIPEFLFNSGTSGVALFFMLSGFVLAWSSRPGDGTAGFWLRRIARIWPLHLVTLALALVLSLTLVPSIRTHDPVALVSDVFLFSSWRTDWWQAGNPVSWSLTCEMFFYALFPLLIRLLRPLRKNGLLVVGLAMLVCLGLAPVIFELADRAVSTYSWPPLRLPEFVIGIVLALLVRQGIWRGPRVAPAALLAVVGYFLIALLVPTGSSPINTTMISDIGFAAVIIALARRDVEDRPTLLASPRSVTLGQVSFAFYLVHLLVIQVAASSWPKGQPHLPPLPAIALAVAAFVCSLGIAFALHHLVELRAQRFVMSLPRRLAGPRQRGTSDAAAPTTKNNN